MLQLLSLWPGAPGEEGEVKIEYCSSGTFCVQVSRPGPGVLVCSSSCHRRMSTISRVSTHSVSAEEPGLGRIAIYQETRGTDSEDTESLTTKSYLREWKPIPRINEDTIQPNPKRQK